MAEISETEYTLIYNRTSALKMGQLAFERFFFGLLPDTQSGLVYSNYCAVKNGKVENMLVIGYQVKREIFLERTYKMNKLNVEQLESYQNGQSWWLTINNQILFR